ncbi:hypothetical protein HKX54_15420 [Sulfitobacter sp. M57]|uniref:hypothetical protein n=1 Tax=unclassified Sulfitobacter TaxID=196795 RepID=UPI0023E13224|nr:MULTISPECIES: hypothetical protein [unclassified Sulfitobacter]MDF3415857.1 hypothetical protein [Sulfitobacter sp. KE5]MDF3423337.1 hypothetical protein [Sulfitobacter sp. KE43]MDF3434403.1 hypothetical protein [Sulfitobacter sp. KE42]MDF3460043.1 hypothetical protein [Sulfitobacter sp. S74]MDF3463941.1 hypothetical protein [Sulfitobacter sp. Ks18]
MLIVSAISFVLLIVLALVGESILPLYGGDRELAARASKVSFVVLGGIAFAFAQPAIWGFFAGALQRVILRGGSNSSMAETLAQPGFKSGVQSVALGLCCLFLIATAVLALHLWRQRW